MGWGQTWHIFSMKSQDALNCVYILDKIFVHKVTKCRASICADCYLGLVCIGLQGSQFLWVLDL